MQIFTLVSFFLAITSGLTGFAGTRDPNTPDSKYVEFGQQFPGVVKIKAKAKCTNPECKLKEHEQFGSAVIIGPNWILTAAHVVHGTTNQVIIKDDGTEYPLQHLIVHDEYVEEKVGWNDLALGYSPTEFKLDFYTPLYTEQDEMGKAITIAGYGIQGTFTSGANPEKSDQKKRAGHNVVDAHADAVLFCSPTAGRTRMPLEFLITPGDSGGGMFIGNKLAGINSFLLAADKKTDGTYGDEAAFTRVSLYTHWVSRKIEQYELALKAQSTTGADLQLIGMEVRP
jgi:secreted trypsin-like serine protease